MTYIDGKPRVRHSNEKLKIRPIPKVAYEIRAAAAGCIRTLHNCIRVWVHPVDARGVASGTKYIANVHRCPLNITVDVHCESWGFRDGQSEVECNDTGNTTQAYENAPAIVHTINVPGDDGVFINSNHYQRDQGSDCGQKNEDDQFPHIT